MINDHKMQGESKVHSGNTVIDYKTQEEPSKDSDEIHTMNTRSNNMENMMSNETDEIIQKLFQSLLQKYQEGLEEKMRGSEFIFTVLIYWIIIFIKYV